MFKPGSRFLVVDDSVIARDLVRAALTQLNQEHVDVAPDGKVGGEMIQKSLSGGEKSYDLVVLDLNMPNVDGFKLLENLRADPRTKELPVLIITTENAKTSVVKAVMHGVVGYMVKPFGVEDVKNKVNDIHQRFISR